ncbi:DUF4240 domain-containing protein [Dactylosporangium sp. CS-033363]|uniref:DUF4240 domain-containing protein n=1 Tax=Dactylosporangium sp. CS-033363 TaxID=3239935 RepID=UPI003D9440B0
MHVDDFWTFLELSRQAGPSQPERETFLGERLARLPRADLLDFVQHLSATREPANTYRLWRAADLIVTQPSSMDSFHYFQMWLVGLGRPVYEAAIDDPDSLAGVPEVVRLAAVPHPWDDEDYPEWESLEYVACQVGDGRADIDGDIRDVVAEERHVRLRMDPDPDDAEWAGLSTAELARRYPRLWTLFGAAWKQ